MNRDGWNGILKSWGLSLSQEREILEGIEENCNDGQIEHFIINFFLKKGDYGWECIVQRCLPVVRGLIRAKVPRWDIEMVEANFLARLWEKIGSYKGKGKLDSWLRKLALSCIADYYRERAKESYVHEFYNIEDGDDVWEEVFREELREKVRSIIQELSPEEATVITGIYWEGLSIKEIARILKKSPRTIYRHLKRAKKN